MNSTKRVLHLSRLVLRLECFSNAFNW